MLSSVGVRNEKRNGHYKRLDKPRMADKFFLLFFLLPDFNQDRLADVIHQGRDHGLPTYIQIRELCGLTPVRNFEELNTTIDHHVITNLRRTYQVRGPSKALAKLPSIVQVTQLLIFSSAKT